MLISTVLGAIRSLTEARSLMRQIVDAPIYETKAPHWKAALDASGRLDWVIAALDAQVEHLLHKVRDEVERAELAYAYEYAKDECETGRAEDGAAGYFADTDRTAVEAEGL